jgi:hypothetical protein
LLNAAEDSLDVGLIRVHGRSVRVLLSCRPGETVTEAVEPEPLGLGTVADEEWIVSSQEREVRRLGDGSVRVRTKQSGTVRAHGCSPGEGDS